MQGAAYLALFVSAFLAATLLPVSSEAVLAALSTVGGIELAWLVLVATVGNTLGAFVNWGLGRTCIRWRDRKWFPVSPESLARATRWFDRYGAWTLLLAWLPVLGDPLTFVAGALGIGPWRFLVLVATGKAARYIAVAVAARGLLG